MFCRTVLLGHSTFSLPYSWFSSQWFPAFLDSFWNFTWDVSTESIDIFNLLLSAPSVWHLFPFNTVWVSVAFTHTRAHTHKHTLAYSQFYVSCVLSHTLWFSGAIKVLSANSVLQILSHVAGGVSLPAVTLWALGTRTSHYFHGKGQRLCHLTKVELSGVASRQWPKVSFLICLSYGWV